MPTIKVDTTDLLHLKGSTARKVLDRCANEVKHWKVPNDFTPDQQSAVNKVLHDIHLCFKGYSAAVGAHMPQQGNELLEKMAESGAKF